MGSFAPQSAQGAAVNWDTSPATPGVQGGGGTWNTSSSNWENNGVNSAWFNSHLDTAVFSGTPGGTVNLSTAITADAIRFDAAGYTIGSPSSALTLNSGSAMANADATISVPISTTAGFFKSGAGTLTLSGSNTFRGTVTLLGGLVAFASESQLGVTPHTIDLSGGGLRYTGSSQLSLSASRPIVVDADGGRLDLSAGTLFLGSPGQLSGVGTLTKSGTQTPTVAAANTTFTGGVNIAAGTLDLRNEGAINARPVTVSGGTLVLRGDQPSSFQSDATVSGDGALDVETLTPSGMNSGAHSLGDMSVTAGGKATIIASQRNYLSVHNLDLAGTLRLNNTAVMVKGTLSGAGAITFGAANQSPELFTSGVLFASGLAQTIANPIIPDDAVAGQAVVGVAAGTTLTYNGAWSGGGASATSSVVLRDGAKFVAGPMAHLNTIASNLTATRPFTVIGTGSANTFELDAAMLADHTNGGAVADGLSSLEIRDATLVTRATQSLPLVTKQDGFGSTHRAGLLVFSGTSGSRWTVATAPQQYDGGVALNTSATFQTDQDLSHTGTVAAKFDGQFQIPVAGVTLTKQGVGRLRLAGNQGYAAGSQFLVKEGIVRFESDPGAGWYTGNFTRGADGNVTAAPTPAGTVTVVADGGAVEFAATPVSRIDKLQVNMGGAARITAGTLVTHSVAASSSGALDIGSNRLIVDYSAGASPLADIAAMIKSGGIVSSATAADATMGVGYAEAADVLRLAAGQTGTFGGQTVDSTSVVVRLTRLGDADLDGEVSFSDFQRFERGFGLTGQSWSSGDFNYDGKVDVADFKLLYDNFGKSADVAISQAASVPEPQMLGVVGVSIAMTVRRRRTRG